MQDSQNRIPKAKAIEQITEQASAVRKQLEVSRTQLKAAVSPYKYTLNLQVNALKKQLHDCKAQIDRIKKDPRADVAWPNQPRA